MSVSQNLACRYHSCKVSALLVVVFHTTACTYVQVCIFFRMWLSLHYACLSEYVCFVSWCVCLIGTDVLTQMAI